MYIIFDYVHIRVLTIKVVAVYFSVPDKCAWDITRQSGCMVAIKA